jgi:leader peptidase (prepilin peptidase)/N-methyltransferase
MPNPLALAILAACLVIASLIAKRELNAPVRIVALALAVLAAVCASGLVVVGVGIDSAALCAAIVMACALIAEIDRRHFLIPDALVLVLLGLAMLAPFAPDWQLQVFGALLAGGLMLGVRQAYRALRGSHGLGLGDVKLALAIGALLGPQTALIVIAVAAIATAALLARPSGQIAIAVRAAPFGVGLAAGTALASILRAGGWA